jgi:hypothetical protein
MTRRRMERLLWGLALGLLAWGRARWIHAVPFAPPAALSAPEAVDPPTLAGLAQRLRQVDSATARNPFRLDRSPAPVAPPSDPLGGQVAPPPFRPSLALSGITGPPWAAVLEGVPEHENGVVVRGGERFGELQVRSVARGGVVVSSSDTTWRLTLRHWP